MAKYSVEELNELLYNAVAVNINGEYYNVHCLMPIGDTLDEEPYVIVYYVDDMCIYDYNYTLRELSEKDVIVYEQKEVTIKDGKVVDVERINA